MKKHIFSGCATALITPFSPDTKEVDYDFFEKFIEFQIVNKTDALVVAGTTGESPLLSRDEKINLIKSAIKANGKRVPVIAGTGSNNTQDAVRKSNDAEKQGVDGLLVVTPYYNKCTQEGLIKHYNYIADRVSTPIIVYNVPSRTGVNILPETYFELGKHKNICAIKEANGDISSAAKTLKLCSESLTMYSGNDDQTIPIIALGGKGVISVASNALPIAMHDIVSYMLKGNYGKALEINNTYLNLMNAFFCETNPIPIKYAIEKVFGKKMSLRLPLIELSDKNKSVLDELLKLGSVT